MVTLKIATLTLASTYSPELPVDAVEYTPAYYTQSVFRLAPNFNAVAVPTIRRVAIKELPDRRWLRSGGMLGVKDELYTSTKYRSGGPPTYKVELIPVKNSSGFYQQELGLTRIYPEGARFDDILSNEWGVVFEHRMRIKGDGGKWQSEVLYRDVLARPKGYEGLKTTCASCHNEAGTGDYGVGLVPGGDTVLSDPMDWKVAEKGVQNYQK